MKYLSLVILFVLTACGNVGGLNLGQYPDVGANPKDFILCHGYGCTEQTRVGFNDADWKIVKRIFKNTSKTAKTERVKISKAIALIEEVIGETADTKNDFPKAPIKRVSSKELDCIDETINTTKYLRFLVDENLLKFHVVDRPVYKGFLINGVYPHNSASIREVETGQIYVVDSYIHANGEEPVIRTLEDWLSYKTFESEEL